MWEPALLVIGRTDRDELPEALDLAGRPMVALPGFTGPLDLTAAR
jgi:hypothetical protein